MTYCEARTNLLAAAGEDLAASLLPAPFKLRYSNHSTGRQMTIVAQSEGKPTLTVWRGSVWHSSIYEFNDREAIPGLQPQCEWVESIIAQYFTDVSEAVKARKAERDATKAAAATKTEEARIEAINFYKGGIQS